MDRHVIWEPQPQQWKFMARPEDEALYGGAAGGGKSDALVIEATRQVHIPYYKGLILRKTFPQLAELIDKSQKYYPLAFPGCRYNATSHTWTFPSGAKIIFGSMHTSQSKYDFQGQAYDLIGFDELTHFSYDEYMYLLSRNRPNGPGTRCYVRATANPGGVGHSWVKERFITAAPPMTTVWDDVEIQHPDGHTEAQRKSRIFVPSTVFDNKILMANDPGYVATLASLPEQEKNALLYGDWNSYTGQFFREFKDDPAHYRDRQWTHVIDPFDIPDGWKIYRSFDWGYARPFSCGWWAVDYDGCLYRILELYGCTETPNEGVRWTPDRVFQEIHKVETEHRWLAGKHITGIADPAIWDAQTGESIADTAQKYRVYFQPGDHKRIPGWLQVRFRMQFSDDGFPRIYIFKNCKGFIRTVPALLHDKTKVEDLDTSMEDHIADDTRYMCMSRPIKPIKAALEKEIRHSPVYQALDIDTEDIAPRHAMERVQIIGG